MPVLVSSFYYEADLKGFRDCQQVCGIKIPAHRIEGGAGFRYA